MHFTILVCISRFSYAHLGYWHAHSRYSYATLRYCHAHLRFSYAHSRYCHAHLRFSYATLRFSYAHSRYCHAHLRFSYAHSRFSYAILQCSAFNKFKSESKKELTAQSAPFAAQPLKINPNILFQYAICYQPPHKEDLTLKELNHSPCQKLSS